MTGQIRKLDEAVINRIAAGEVVQRPVNAVKELIENSLDAKATAIQVTLKSGGLKLVQIQDNGCGIQKEDLPIVCERFTTSKLEKFEDLNRIATYGFRGEALASISHVAHVTITTRTVGSPCAFRAHYSDGKLVAPKPGVSCDPKPCAGNQGTQIMFEDLFYNMPTRRNTMRSGTEEHAKIADVITKYALHNSGVAFTLKKQTETVADVRTTAHATVVDNIKTLYGANIARELLHVDVEDSKLGFRLHAEVTNANFSTKKSIFVLFINHRLVESTALRRAVDTIYAAYLPRNSHPFVYMSVEIAPANIDVNVHPTKREVHFLHEDSIIESIQHNVEQQLLGCNTSRTYSQQVLLLGASQSLSLDTDSDKRPEKTYAKHMVRTDAREQTLDAFLSPSQQTSESRAEECEMETVDAQHETEADAVMDASGTDLISTEDSGQKQASGSTKSKDSSLSSQKQPLIDGDPDKLKLSGLNQPHRRIIRLTSVLTLRQRVIDAEHTGIREMFQNYKFVGCCTESLALIQYRTKLFIVNFARISKELFYQLMLFDFGNFGVLKLSDPPYVKDLVTLGLDQPDSGWNSEDGCKEKTVEQAVAIIRLREEMLADYFSIEISPDGRLVSLPWLLEKFVPDMANLPSFILRLAFEVEWDYELTCFETLSRQCSELHMYSPSTEQLRVQKDTDQNDEDDATVDDSDNMMAMSFDKPRGWKWTVEHVLFPAFRTVLIPPKKFAEDSTIVEVANLPDLYKVFERC
ncbi:DNA mismatch repair protein Mlh1-like isoform X2 [Corticium candelabrum]|uniref:DNA mismatch repair protein Mlh1-like isoform X2 n=1 Tax=Corticium candelabrum TaxID=121492 RepID=UPI002E268B2B|nr:DNA mismatch repair protein Mlh1-like isoform X2 [Corticium candelabrum]